jgi:hypothetical protein
MHHWPPPFPFICKWFNITFYPFLWRRWHPDANFSNLHGSLSVPSYNCFYVSKEEYWKMQVDYWWLLKALEWLVIRHS